MAIITDRDAFEPVPPNATRRDRVTYATTPNMMAHYSKDPRPAVSVFVFASQQASAISGVVRACS